MIGDVVASQLLRDLRALRAIFSLSTFSHQTFYLIAGTGLRPNEYRPEVTVDTEES